MTTDITNLKEADLLTTLGDGDWVIVMPERYSNLLVTRQWRDEIMAWVGVCFVRWVLSGIHYEMNYDNDPPWDHSGDARRQNADPLMLRTLYNTLAQWFEEERTGQWEATYESGYGKFWQTYERVVEDHIRERLSDLLHMQYDHLFVSSPDDFNDTVWEEADLVIICLEQALLLMIGSLSTDTVYKQFEALTHQTLEEEKRDAAERDAHYARMSTLTHQFWQTHFSHLQGLSLEQPQFKALRLAERLHELFPDADPQLIIAVAEIGLPGIFSNSVRDEIKAIARDLLK